MALVSPNKEVELLREVFERARQFLRNNGVCSAFALSTHLDNLDTACEHVKLFDSGLMDADSPAESATPIKDKQA